MSEKLKIDRLKAEEVAIEICDKLSPFCERISIAGSLRRQKSFVGDIELLFIPKFAPDPSSLMGALFGTGQAEMIDMADTVLNRLRLDGVLRGRPNVNGSTVWGKQNKLAIHTASGIPVDFFSTTTENWWVALVIRTGGKVTNLKLTTSANRRGLTLNAYGSGFTNLRTREKIPCRSEQEVFRIAGVPYAPPERRE